MIDCPNGDVRDALPEYLNDRLDPARRAEVESHLLRCDACRAELSLLRDLRATMRRPWISRRSPRRFPRGANRPGARG